jgi:RNA recognition motif-containing protein
MKLFVGNLPYDVTEDDLKELFEKFGKIKSLILITDRETKKSRGFGFVEFSDKENAIEAIKKLNGSTIDSRSIVVKEAHNRNNNNRPQRRRF